MVADAVADPLGDLLRVLAGIYGDRASAERWVRSHRASYGPRFYQREADALNEWLLRRSRD